MNSEVLNGDQLPACKTFGTPCVANIFSNFFRFSFHAIDVTNSTSRYLEYWSVTTTTYSLLGSGPQKPA